jgi:tRNA pseudouridine38-40 synthase
MYLIYISFYGNKYHGWQYQDNALTVQEVVHTKLEEILKVKLPYPHGCSRTDTGVHALEFLATLPNLYDIPAEALQKGLNSLLPDDIRISKVEKKEGFLDARELIKGKHYRYLICTKKVASPFASDLSWHSAYKLDIKKMNEALSHFIGKKDFASFMSAGSAVKTTVRTVSDARILKTGDYLIFDFKGDGFLKHQIRIMSGTLVAVGRNRLKSDQIPDIIAAKDRTLVPHTLPGKGLFLYKLFFSLDEMSDYKFPETFKEIIW